MQLGVIVSSGVNEGLERLSMSDLVEYADSTDKGLHIVRICEITMKAVRQSIHVLGNYILWIDDGRVCRVVRAKSDCSLTLRSSMARLIKACAKRRLE